MKVIIRKNTMMMSRKAINLLPNHWTRIVVFFIVGLAVGFCRAENVSAYSTRVIKKSEMTRMATFPLKTGTSLQGNTITKDYFVFSDFNKHNEGSAVIRIVDRTNCGEAGSINMPNPGAYMHTSGLYNKWGSNYIYIVNRAFDSPKNQDSCIDIANKTQVALSKCPSRPTYVEVPELDKKYYTKHVPGNKSWQGQGSTFAHNGYYFRVMWKKNLKDRKKTVNYIYVFKDRKTVLKRYELASGVTPECSPNFEIEDISVDGDTGDVYVGYNCQKKAIYYRIDSSVFGKYTKGSNTTQREVAVCDNYDKPVKTVKIGKASAKKDTNDNRNNTANNKNNNSGGGTSDNTGSGGNNNTNGNTGNKNANNTAQNSTNNKATTNSDSSTDNKNKTKQSKSDSECTQTNIIGGGEVCDDGKGSGVKHILELVMTILSVGVGVVGTIGIMICGIQYLTAGSNAANAAKARRRMLEIVIGLALYAALFLLARWLLG